MSKAHVYRLLADRLKPLHWELRPEEMRHAVSVLRLKAGQPLELTDGAGNWARAAVETVERKEITVSIISEHEETVDQRLTMIVGALKPAAMDEMLPMLCELGVTQVTVFGQEGVASHRFNEKTKARWLRLTEQSIKQCKRAWLPDIQVVDSLAAALSQQAEAGCYLSPGADRSLVEFVGGAKNLTCVVGGERGLTDQEIELLAANGWQSARLGSHILRAVTAAVSAAAIHATANA